jgi:hypothetical protein
MPLPENLIPPTHGKVLLNVKVSADGGAHELPNLSALRLRSNQTVEGGSVMPPSTNGVFARLRLIEESNGNTILETPLNVSAITVPFPAISGLYLVVIDNLPPGYSVKSVTCGQRDVRKSGLRVSSDDLSKSNLVVESPSELSITLVAATQGVPPWGN